MKLRKGNKALHNGNDNEKQWEGRQEVRKKPINFSSKLDKVDTKGEWKKDGEKKLRGENGTKEQNRKDRRDIKET